MSTSANFVAADIRTRLADQSDVGDLSSMTTGILLAKQGAGTYGPLDGDADFGGNGFTNIGDVFWNSGSQLSLQGSTLAMNIGAGAGGGTLSMDAGEIHNCGRLNISGSAASSPLLSITPTVYSNTESFMVYDYTGNYRFGINASGTGVDVFTDLNFNGTWGQVNIRLPSTSIIGWNAGAYAYQPLTVGLSRNADGVLEVNTGTPGTFANLVCNIALLKAGTLKATAIGTLFESYADTASTTSTSIQDLYSYTLPAGLFVSNGDKVRMCVAVAIKSTGGATKTIGVSIAGTQVYTTGALTVTTAGILFLDVLIWRVSSSSIRVSVNPSTFTTGLLTPTVTDITGLTLTNTQIAKTTTTVATGAAAGDVTAKSAVVEYLPTSGN